MMYSNTLSFLSLVFRLLNVKCINFIENRSPTDRPCPPDIDLIETLRRICLSSSCTRCSKLCPTHDPHGASLKNSCIPLPIDLMFQVTRSASNTSRLSLLRTPSFSMPSVIGKTRFCLPSSPSSSDAASSVSMPPSFIRISLTSFAASSRIFNSDRPVEPRALAPTHFAGSGGFSILGRSLSNSTTSPFWSILVFFFFSALDALLSYPPKSDGLVLATT
mmetsp:Transcript_18137/g.59572  ORF Transcript_18137/g.59572 Transcript_18137/m.59572 type:complete len:219 (-) Transcript_18137:278-934(-)